MSRDGRDEDDEEEGEGVESAVRQLEFELAHISHASEKHHSTYQMMSPHLALQAPQRFQRCRPPPLCIVMGEKKLMNRCVTRRLKYTGHLTLVM